jgi:hypothetical protein
MKSYMVKLILKLSTRPNGEIYNINHKELGLFVMRHLMGRFYIVYIYSTWALYHLLHVPVLDTFILFQVHYFTFIFIYNLMFFRNNKRAQYSKKEV